MDTNHTTSLSTEKTTAGPAPTHGQGGEASEHEDSQDKPGQDGGGVKTESHLLRPLGCGLLGTGIGGRLQLGPDALPVVGKHGLARHFTAGKALNLSRMTQRHGAVRCDPLRNRGGADTEVSREGNLPAARAFEPCRKIHGPIIRDYLSRCQGIAEPVAKVANSPAP